MIKVADLPVKLEHNEVLIPVGVNGQQSWFIVDTGAVNTSIFNDAAASLGLRQYSGRQDFCGVGGCQRANLVNVASFELSGSKINGLSMFVVGRGGGRDRAGLLGRDVLGNWDLEFDLANKALRLWTVRGCGSASLAYWTKDPGGAPLHQEGQGGEYRVQVAINGKPVDATLDSGAYVTTISPEIAARAGVGKQDYEGPATQTGGIGANRVETRIANLKSLTIGTEQVSNTKVSVADMFADVVQEETGRLIARHVQVDMDAPTMLLGADFLRSHRVLIAPQQHLLYFSYNGGPIFEVTSDPAKRITPSPDAGQPPATAPAGGAVAPTSGPPH